LITGVILSCKNTHQPNDLLVIEINTENYSNQLLIVKNLYLYKS